MLFCVLCFLMHMCCVAETVIALSNEYLFVSSYTILHNAYQIHIAQ